MINAIVKAVSGKEVILVNKHRHTLPLLTKTNLEKYIFFDPRLLWKFTFIFGRNTRLRYQAIAFILNVIRPKYIIDVNWINKLNSLYFAWCNRNKTCRFVVVQHGSYVGGIITDYAHRYAKCNTMLCWSDYFRNEFIRYNKGKKRELLIFGNSVYNQHNRASFSYPVNRGKKVLVAPSVISAERKTHLENFMRVLQQAGFNVFVKEHNFQATMAQPITGFDKISGNLYHMLETKEFDIIISDISSCLLDALFFKNNTLFFSPQSDFIYYTENIYSKFMKNIAFTYTSVTTAEDVWQQVDHNAQEQLFTYLVEQGDNNLQILNQK